jgi:chromosome partitioning protein
MVTLTNPAPETTTEKKRIICVVNQKGGVGKTTTSVNLAAAMAKAGHRTLLIDMDPQCNATVALDCKVAARHPLISDDEIADAVLATKVPLLDVLPGSRSFQDVDKLAQSDGPERELVRQRLDSLHANYNFILIDCPPTLGTLTEAALAASTEVLIPIQCEYFAMEGLAQLIEVIRRVIHRTDGRLTFGGILLTMYDPYLELTGEVDSDVRDFFGEIVFDTVIPRDVSLSEAPSHGQSVFDYAPRSRGAFAYTQLCMEVLERD